MVQLISTLFKLAIVMLLVMTCSSQKNYPKYKLGARNKLDLPMVKSQRSKNLSLEYEAFNYTQILDHFNFKTGSSSTFQQRYLVVSKYWGGPDNISPIFFYAGDESDILFDIEDPGFPLVLASRFNALLVYIEHRYYGTSMPFGSKEEAYKNTSTLGYFTSEQALADYAEIILDVKKNLLAEKMSGYSYWSFIWWNASFVVPFEISPHCIRSLCIMILYFMGLTPETGYDSVVSKDLNSTSVSCYNTIRESWSEIDRVAAQPNGLLNLSQMFNTCIPLNTSKNLKDGLEMRYDSLAQYDNPNRNVLPRFCNATDESGESYILNKIVAGLIAYRGNVCLDIFDSSRNKDFGWDWQACTEMVMPMGRGENDTMFQADPFDLGEYIKDCQQVFNVTPRPYWIPTEFGGYGIKTVLEKFASNIIFSNGLRDPFSSGGVLQNISDSVVATYTEDGHHCLDFNTAYDTDPNWLIAQRDFVINIIQEWLSKYTVPN